MKRIACFIAAATLAAGASTAHAACAARDLQGTWQFYNTWVDDVGDLGWSRCQIELDKTGAVLDVFDCADSDIGPYEFVLVSGALTITPECVVTGEIVYDDDGSDEAAEFSHATMSARKELIAGVGGDLDAPGGDRIANWTFTMVAK